MRAYIVIVALAVVAMSACIYTVSPQVRLSTGLNCTVDCSGLMPATSGLNSMASTTKTIVHMAINPFMKAASLT